MPEDPARCPPRRAPAVPRGDALFLAEAPAFVPDDVDAELESMRIVRLYVPAATMSAIRRDHAAAPAAHAAQAPPRPHGSRRGGRGDGRRRARGRCRRGVGARSLAKILGDAKGWGRVEGVHFHLWPSPELAKDLARGARRGPQALSACRSPSRFRRPAQPERWKPLAGAASEALVLAFGRRPELGGQIVSELPEEIAREFPIPFRLLVAFGGYGRTGDGTTFAGRMLPDGRIDQLSEDRALDFDFGQMFSSEPGTVCTFKPRAGTKGSTLAADGGHARFQFPTMGEGLRFLAASAAGPSQTSAGACSSSAACRRTATSSATRRCGRS